MATKTTKITRQPDQPVRVGRATWRHRLKEPSTWLGIGSVIAMGATQGWAALLSPEFVPMMMTALGLTVMKEGT